MKKQLSALTLSATFMTSLAAPVFANTPVEGIAKTQVSTELVELDGRVLTDVEATKVEGEAWWLLAIPAIGAATGVVNNATVNRLQGKPWHQNWGSSAIGGAVGASGTAGCVLTTKSPACAGVGIGGGASTTYNVRKWNGGRW
jgi:hypothetical protein